VRPLVLLLPALVLACGGGGSLPATGGDAATIASPDVGTVAADAGDVVADTAVVPADAAIMSADAADAGGGLDAAGTDQGATLDASTPDAPDAGLVDASGPADASPADLAVPMAQLKFCNALQVQGGQDLVLSLEVGTPPVVLTAHSGTCNTPTGSPCANVAAGQQVVRLIDDQGLEIASGVVSIGAGEQWMMLATIAGGQPTVRGGLLMPQYACSTVDPFTTPDAGP
jgi:hypothetical protein